MTHAGAKIVLVRQSRKPPRSSRTVDTSADDPGPDHLHLRHPREIQKRRAACASGGGSAILPNVEMCHRFSCPKPGDLMWTPADWAWIGGLIKRRCSRGWYHGVPIVRPTAPRKFEPQAAMQMMADHGIRNVFPAADRAES